MLVVKVTVLVVEMPELMAHTLRTTVPTLGYFTDDSSKHISSRNGLPPSITFRAESRLEVC